MARIRQQARGVRDAKTLPANATRMPTCCCARGLETPVPRGRTDAGITNNFSKIRMVIGSVTQEERLATAWNWANSRNGVFITARAGSRELRCGFTTGWNHTNSRGLPGAPGAPRGSRSIPEGDLEARFMQRFSEPVLFSLLEEVAR
jgi:hypothetical protein